MSGAVQIGIYFDAAPDIECANPLGGIEFMTGHRQQINTKIIDPDRKLAK